MKRKTFRMAALAAALLLILCVVPGAVAENTQESAAQATAETTEKPKASAAQLQSQGILSVGAKGEEVTRLQQRLKDLGYLDGKVDGEYGKITKRAVIAFQRRNGLDADGMAGQETQGKLYAEDAIPAPDSTPVDVLEGSLPMLVNKDYPVDEYFVPKDLVLLKDELGSKLVTIKYKKTRGVKIAVDALRTMLEAAKAAGLKKWQISAGYRTWDDQESMLNSKIKSYQNSKKGMSKSKARQAALKSVAEPGCSEHHLGLAFDINVKGASSFAGTKQSAWLNEHCWEYGFIIRYQKEKEEITGFVAEPWHIRYVGVEHALYMKENNLCLEEYIQGIEDGTINLAEPEDQELTETEDTEESDAA